MKLNSQLRVHPKHFPFLLWRFLSLVVLMSASQRWSGGQSTISRHPFLQIASFIASIIGVCNIVIERFSFPRKKERNIPILASIVSTPDQG
jgi:hypothetical protein